ncbi:MAG: methyltransferase domain-containing protein [Planctomycetales bacterium]|nr:methyltransferase domain-containing protein [Planctomycetales bacterium]
MVPSAPPNWRLPRGVPRGLWDYFHSAHIAEDYDDYFAFNSLFEMDGAVLAREFDPLGTVVDLGCGTGRALVPLVRRGHRGIAVDLSQHMLEIVQEKMLAEDLAIECVLANLVELDGLRDAAADYAMCMFSTLGMIRGRTNRRQVLRHACRILKPGGKLVIHIHNFWFNLFDPGGPWWVLKSLARAAYDREFELGDKFFPYRGIPSMFLHVFRRGELTRDLHQAGFASQRWILLDTQRRFPLPWPWLLGRVRANGWIVVCEKPPEISTG